MKRILSTMLAILAVSLCAVAQSGLEINKIFGGKYSSDPNVTETVISGNQAFLQSRKLRTFATFKGDAQTYARIIRPLVMADGSHATARDVRYRHGELHYAFFILPQTEVDGKTVNRYLYYLNNQKASRPTVMVIYFDGSLNSKQAEDLIKSLSKK